MSAFRGIRFSAAVGLIAQLATLPAAAQSPGYLEDYINFGSGPLPTDIVFTILADSQEPDGLESVSFQYKGTSPFHFYLAGRTAEPPAVLGVRYYADGADITDQVTADFGSGRNYGTGTGPTSTVPEPATMALLATGLIGLGLADWYRRRRSYSA